MIETALSGSSSAILGGLVGFALCVGLVLLLLLIY
jgi:hypothetical protein